MQKSSPIVYAVKHKDETVRASSRSGGIFTALSDQILSEGGVIYGCVLDEKFNVRHIRAVTAAGRDRMRGSKYVQSDLTGIFAQVKEDLSNGKKVLFSGTSCQVAGLKSFLGKEYDGLICVDIVCYGVPSPVVYQAFLKWNEEKQKSPLKTIIFRNKADFGWNSHVATMYFENGMRVDSQIFRNMFSSRVIERPSCFKCPYKSVIRVSDITIGDYWGIDQAVPGFNDNKGVSLVLINNEKGNKFFEQIRNVLEVKNTRIEDSMQPALQAPFPEPQNRYHFWRDYEKNGFDYIAKKYGTVSFFAKLKRKIKRIIKSVVK